nr:hypothetical protein [Phycisphaerales bacterium]
GTQRPVAMRHLDRLASSDPAARDHIRGVLMQLLAAKPDLRPWMSSYTNWLFADREPSRRDDRGALIHPPHPGLAMTQAPRAAVPSQPRGHA